MIYFSRTKSLWEHVLFRGCFWTRIWTWLLLNFNQIALLTISHLEFACCASDRAKYRRVSVLFRLLVSVSRLPFTNLTSSMEIRLKAFQVETRVQREKSGPISAGHMDKIGNQISAGGSKAAKQQRSNKRKSQEEQKEQKKHFNTSKTIDTTLEECTRT